MWLEYLKKETELSDIFIKPNFVIDSLNTLFEAAGQNKIITLFKAKSEASTCNICDQLCYEKAIQCEKILTSSCSCWYHQKCVDVSAYIRSAKKVAGNLVPITGGWSPLGDGTVTII